MNPGSDATGLTTGGTARCDVQFGRDLTHCTSVIQSDLAGGTPWSMPAMTMYSWTPHEQIGITFSDLGTSAVAVVADDAGGNHVLLPQLPTFKLLVFCWTARRVGGAGAPPTPVALVLEGQARTCSPRRRGRASRRSGSPSTRPGRP